jgi:hypothetical protein
MPVARCERCGLQDPNRLRQEGYHTYCVDCIRRLRLEALKKQARSYYG